MSPEPPPSSAGDAPAATPPPWPARPGLPPSDDPDPLPALEAAFSAFAGLPAEQSLACASRADALGAALRDAVDGPLDGAEVVVPALLDGATRDALLALGLALIPAEVDGEAAAISTRGLVRALGPDTRAVLVRHAFGHPAPLTELQQVATRHGAPLVELADEALGGMERGRPVGTVGRSAVFGFGAGHLVDARGAMLVSGDPARAAALRAARPAAIGADDARGALGALARAGEALEIRRRVAWELTFAVRRMRGIAGMPHGRFVRHGYDRYVVRLRALLWKRDLDDTIAALRAAGIPAERALEPALHADEAVMAGAPGDPRFDPDLFPVASRLPNELVAIPLHEGMTQREVDHVAATLVAIELP